MRTRLGFMLALLPATVILASCRIGHRSFDDDHHRHRPRRVSHAHRVTHVCTLDCHHHYWDGTAIIALSAGHHHDAHCGHHCDGEYWVVARRQSHVSNAARGPRRVQRRGHEGEHEHSATCGHVYNRKKHKWTKTRKGHIHRKGCGHRFVRGRWAKRG